MMHCNGQCVLSKKLKDQESQNQAPVSRSEKFDAQPFFVPEAFTLHSTVAVIKTEYFIKDENVISSFASSIFHPPSA